MPSSSWIASLDVDNYVRQLMMRESLHVDEMANASLTGLSAQQDAIKTQLSSYGQLQSLLQTFQQNMQSVIAGFNSTYRITNSNPSVATADISGQSIAGSHTVNVTQLAQSETLATQNSFGSKTTALGMTNDVTFTVGSLNFSVSITADDTLQSITDKINAGAKINNVPIAASVVALGNGQSQLLVSSTQTGVANKVTFSETGVGSDSLGLTNELVAAKNAQYTFDGLSFDQASNTSTIQGMNISLLSVGQTILSVTTAISTDDILSGVEKTISAYNDVLTLIDKTQSMGKGLDSILNTVKSSLQATMSSALIGNDPFNRLSDIGITSFRATPINITLTNGTTGICYPTGLLQVDKEKLASALKDDLSHVQTLLTDSNKGIISAVNDSLKDGIGSVWKVINDSDKGGIHVANMQLNKINEKIAETKSAADAAKSALKEKYAKLDILLLQLQSQSQFLAQQVEVMKASQG